MASNWAPFMLLLATLSAVHIQEVASASYRYGPLSEFGRKSRRQTSGEQNVGSNTGPRVTSPCPGVLRSVNVDGSRGRWNGIISITPDESATGVVLDIQLDSRAELIGTSFGEVSTADNIIHTIRDDNREVEIGQRFNVQFFVKFDEKAADPPRLKTIRFNGKQICPLEEVADEPPTTTPEVTPPITIPPAPSTSAMLDAGDQNRKFSAVKSAIPIGVPSRRPPDESRRRNTTRSQLYTINGEFKINSDAQLLILLIARPSHLPHEENSSESQTENLDQLLATVFGSPDDYKGDTATSEYTGPQVPSSRNNDEPEEEPPFTSAPETSTASSIVRTTAGSPTADSATTEQIPVEAEPLQWESPCPGVFSYLANAAGSDTWYGTLTLTSEEHLFGVRLDVEMDKPTRFLGAWLGEVTSTDNIRYTIWNSSAEVQAGETISVRIFSKHDRDEADPPRIKTIRLNGRQICPARKGPS